ncbi:MAG: tryptophan 2,3-dioxygenase [Bacteroidetes bacterium]|nr:tryptophan 2,3-dioxygenase [Bacteroidota bacterium]
MSKEKTIQDLELKYQQLGENPETYLKGLLQAKPITYWDYIQVDTLLSLQKTRTHFKDEVIFVMYHQVTELVLKMMIHEIEQLVFDDLAEPSWMDKLNRLNRYTAMLITSFDVMRSGMNYDDYNTFRSTLTPASGFQSAQFRYLEIYCTRLENLINEEGKKRLPPHPSIEQLFEHIYWKDAGTNRHSGKKSLTLQLFEEKYLDNFIALAKKVTGNTLEEKAKKFSNPSPELIQKLKEFDDLYNVQWPLVHLQTAQHYLDSQGEAKAATGGSEWKKYLHPKFQQRKFFPELWPAEDIARWGERKEKITNH